MSNLGDAINKGDGNMSRFGGWQEEKKAELEWAFEATDEQARFTFADKENLYKHFSTQARLMHLSATNVLLLAAQNANVSDIEKYDVWQKRGRPVKRGEKGLVTLAGMEYTKKDGSLGMSWSTYNVFDISQTTGEPPLETELAANLRNGVSFDFMSMAMALIQNAPAEIVVVDKLPGDKPAVYRDGKILVPDVADADDAKQIISSIYALGYGCTAAYRQQEGKPNDPLINACGGVLGNISLGTLPPPDALEMIVKNAPQDVRGQKRILGETRASGEKLMLQIEKTRETYRTEHMKAVRGQMIEHKHKNTEHERTKGS